MMKAVVRIPKRVTAMAPPRMPEAKLGLGGGPAARDAEGDGGEDHERAAEHDGDQRDEVVGVAAGEEGVGVHRAAPSGLLRSARGRSDRGVTRSGRPPAGATTLPRRRAERSTAPGEAQRALQIPGLLGDGPNVFPPMATEAHLKEHRIAVFFDFENIITGVRDAKYDQFHLELILDRLVEKGKIIYKRAYCDWSRFREHKNEMHEHSFELVDIPKKRISGKNSADIRMVVDALDLCYRREPSRPSRWSRATPTSPPLATKLTEYNKYVIGIGVKNSTSSCWSASATSSVFYEDLVREKKRPPRPVVAVTAASPQSDKQVEEPRLLRRLESTSERSSRNAACVENLTSDSGVLVIIRS